MCGSTTGHNYSVLLTTLFICLLVLYKLISVALHPSAPSSRIVLCHTSHNETIGLTEYLLCTCNCIDAEKCIDMCHRIHYIVTFTSNNRLSVLMYEKQRIAHSAGTPQCPVRYSRSGAWVKNFKNVWELSNTFHRKFLLLFIYYFFHQTCNNNYCFHFYLRVERYSFVPKVNSSTRHLLEQNCKSWRI